MDLRRIFQLLRQQLWLLLALTLSALAAFLVLPKIGASATYVSTAKVLLTPAQRGLTQDRTMGDTGSWIADQQTLNELVTSERLLQRVAQVVNLRGNWQDLRGRIHLEPLSFDYARRVNLFSISIENDEAAQAQKIASAIIQEFVTYVEELSAREFANTRRFLEELVAEAKEKVDDTEEKLLQITTRHASPGTAETTAESLNSLDSDRRKVKEELAMAEAELESVQSFLSGQSPVIPASILAKSADNGLDPVDSSVAQARLKLMELEGLYTDTNIQVIAQRAKVAKMQQLYQGRLKDFANSVAQEKSQIVAQRRKQLRAIEERASEIRNQQLTPSEKRMVAKLERQLNMWEENHLNLIKQLYQARVMEQSSRRQGAITILENPSPGVIAKAKNARSLGAQLALGVPFCLAFAVAVILGIDLISASLRLVPKIEAALDSKVLAVIPTLDEDLRQLWEAYKREETLPLELESLLDSDVSDKPPATLDPVAPAISH